VVETRLCPQSCECNHNYICTRCYKTLHAVHQGIMQLVAAAEAVTPPASPTRTAPAEQKTPTRSTTTVKPSQAALSYAIAPIPAVTDINDDIVTRGSTTKPKFRKTTQSTGFGQLILMARYTLPSLQSYSSSNTSKSRVSGSGIEHVTCSWCVHSIFSGDFWKSVTRGSNSVSRNQCKERSGVTGQRESGER
jgi:hypothetical protein